MTLSGFVIISGSIDRILSRHDTQDVSVSTSTNTSSSGSTETHTFVNSQREFAALLEVGGRTLKLVHSDYIPIATGDQVRAICEPVENGPLLVRDWLNLSRGIAWRHMKSPARAWAEALFRLFFLSVFAGLFLAVGAALIGFDQSFLVGVAGFVVLAAVLLPIGARRAAEIRAAHEKLDWLAQLFRFGVAK